MEMITYSVPSVPANTEGGERWPYDEYYIGGKDEDGWRCGQGENHWTSNKYSEWYSGKFLRGTMHGPGDYRWRQPGSYTTYEGYFYANHMHGYGTMSYPDGRTFKGLYWSDWVWGPGVMSHLDGHEDVGLWRGSRLVRLAWKPGQSEMQAIPDFFMMPRGLECIERHRLVVTPSHKTIGPIRNCSCLQQYNSNEHQAEALQTVEQDPCPKHCSKIGVLCLTELFDYAYFGKYVQNLKEIEGAPQFNATSTAAESPKEPTDFYYAWNKNPMTFNMMKHCFKHDHQRSSIDLNLARVLSGPRENFKPPGEHEIDCRSILMASYLGQIACVSSLINDQNIYPDIADMQGNTALMYATCGNQRDIMHFLVLCGACVDSYNDAGLTPLGCALMTYASIYHDYTASNILRGVIPPETHQYQLVDPQHVEPAVFEWNITRESPLPPLQSKVSKHSKMSVKSLMRVNKSLLTMKSYRPSRASILQGPIVSTLTLKERDKSRSVLRTSKSPTIIDDPLVIQLSEEEQIYMNICKEFEAKVAEQFTPEIRQPRVPYLFEFHEKPPPSRSPTKNLPKGLPEHEDAFEKNKMDKLIAIHSTIQQLLSDGADPKLVRCPQPALVMALSAGSADLVTALVERGADVNEVYPQIFGYTPLDIAIHRPLTPETTEIVRVLLDNNATADHRLPNEDKLQGDDYPEGGPTLLHVIMSKDPANQIEKEARINILKLLLEHGCDAYASFNGGTVLDAVFTARNLDLLDIFINSLNGNLNKPINHLHQTILVKMFSVPCFRTISPDDRHEILTSLLINGADPLLECRDGTETYPSVIVYALKCYQATFRRRRKKSTSPPSSSREKYQTVKMAHPKKGPHQTRGGGDRREKRTSPQARRLVGSKIYFNENTYRDAMYLVSEWTRLMHIKWIQTKLMKELVEVVDKFKQRAWHLIIKEHKNRHAVSLWLSTVKCLELWDIQKETKQKVYSDNKVLKSLLCIVQYYKMRQHEIPKFTFREKELIESDISKLVTEHKMVAEFTQPTVNQHRAFPGLGVGDDDKFKVCFECSLPLGQSPMACILCGLVSFCNVPCLIENCTRGIQCHPCSDYLTDMIIPNLKETSSEYMDTADKSSPPSEASTVNIKNSIRKKLHINT